ncbi:helix-turn-helix domain-containing protein [Paenibacillus maysiensis]|uniref:helix-turn-helix domain-containing protein n=1 Tax=Paenibacillus maysiensis TaxID=1155954 RepID=UPI000472C2B5|nr:helix-turn-helix transcriptional regulator [Paenibacillus maysiensis]
MQTLGDRIKYLREKRAITQKELAKKTGLTIVQLSRYETNTRKPDPESLKCLADALETTSDYLIGRTDMYHSNDASNDHKIHNKEFEDTITLILETASKWGLSPTDPKFKEVFLKVIEMVALARRENRK